MVSWVPYSSPSLSTRGRPLPAGSFQLDITTNSDEIQQKQKEDLNSRKTSGKLGLRHHIKTERKLSQLRIQSGKFIASNNLGSQNFQNYFMQTI